MISCPGGSGMVRRACVFWASASCVARYAAIPKPSATAASTAAAIQGRRRGRGGAAGSAVRSVGPAAIHSSSLFRSRADCQRLSGSFSRHLRSARSRAGGATSAIDGAGRSMIAAITLAGDEPSKARLPVSSSYSTWMSSVAAFCLCMAVIPIHGQSAAASVSGTVTDTTGAVVQGARLLFRNTDTNVEQSTLTGSSGSYSVVNVAPGNYTIEVKKTGFNASVETGVILAVNQAAIFNFSLHIGSVEQSVSVSAEAAEVQSSTAELGAVIGTKSVND